MLILDAGLDAGSVLILDAGADGGLDAGSVLILDAGADGGLDAGSVLILDAGADAGTASSDAGTASSDAGFGILLGDAGLNCIRENENWSSCTGDNAGIEAFGALTLVSKNNLETLYLSSPKGKIQTFSAQAQFSTVDVCNDKIDNVHDIKVQNNGDQILLVGRENVCVAQEIANVLHCRCTNFAGQIRQTEATFLGDNFIAVLGDGNGVYTDGGVFIDPIGNGYSGLTVQVFEISTLTNAENNLLPPAVSKHVLVPFFNTPPVTSFPIHMQVLIASVTSNERTLLISGTNNDSTFCIRYNDLGEIIDDNACPDLLGDKFLAQVHVRADNSLWKYGSSSLVKALLTFTTASIWQKDRDIDVITMPVRADSEHFFKLVEGINDNDLAFYGDHGLLLERQGSALQRIGAEVFSPITGHPDLTHIVHAPEQNLVWAAGPHGAVRMDTSTTPNSIVARYNFNQPDNFGITPFEIVDAKISATGDLYLATAFSIVKISYVESLQQITATELEYFADSRNSDGGVISSRMVEFSASPEQFISQIALYIGSTDAGPTEETLYVFASTGDVFAILTNESFSSNNIGLHAHFPSTPSSFNTPPIWIVAEDKQRVSTDAPNLIFTGLASDTIVTLSGNLIGLTTSLISTLVSNSNNSVFDLQVWENTIFQMPIYGAGIFNVSYSNVLNSGNAPTDLEQKADLISESCIFFRGQPRRELGWATRDFSLYDLTPPGSWIEIEAPFAISAISTPDDNGFAYYSTPRGELGTIQFDVNACELRGLTPFGPKKPRARIQSAAYIRGQLWLIDEAGTLWIKQTSTN